jgi:hypothetical protein
MCAVKEFILACAIADLPVVVCAALACPMPRLRASVLIATSQSGRLMADHDDEQPATCSLPTRSDTSLIQGADHGKAVCHVALLFKAAHIVSTQNPDAVSLQPRVRHGKSLRG